MAYRITILSVLYVNLLIMNAGIEARTIIVDSSGNGDYLTIQEGMAAAEDGDTVYVCSGIYYERGIQMKNNVVLLGAGAESCKIHGGTEILPWPNHTVILVDSVSQCKIEGFSLSCKGMGITVTNSKAYINHNIMDSCFTGVFCRYNSEVEMLNNLIINCETVGIGVLDTSKITIVSNIVYHAIAAGIEIVKNSQGKIINNVIHENGPYGLRVVLGSNCTVYNSIIWNHNDGISTESDLDSILIEYSDIQCHYLEEPWEGTGNICSDPMFVDYPSYDFRLQSNSPCINAGHPDAIYNDFDGSRNNMGAFGGPYGDWLFSEVNDKNTIILPTTFRLFQNYPNPFNSSTTVSYMISKSSFVSLKIYDLLGREVETLINAYRLPGMYEIRWMGDHLHSGMYLYRLQSGDYFEIRKLILLK